MANNVYAEAVRMVESKLWSQERAALKISSTREAHPADWPPEERPGFDDIEAARLLGVEPRPPSLDVTAQVAYWPKTMIINPQTWDELKASLEEF